MDLIHQGLDSSRHDFDLFIYCYQACMGPSITATNIPSVPRCFEISYIIQHHGEGTESLDSQNSDHVQAYIPKSYTVLRNFVVPVYYDVQPRGYNQKNATILSQRRVRHLQKLHDEDVEARIRALLPEVENWLSGTLRLPKDISHDPGNITPSVDVDRQLVPVRDLLYRGYGSFALIRTSRDVLSPQNISKAVYTVLKVDGPGFIGTQKVAVGESILVKNQVILTAGLILLISVSPAVVVGGGMT
ncbi:hypothetical protein AKAW_10722 [Aspergillus luchuensis IFO 4308]|nr:hypothetical protein AKAW_10722 [Aspergillus luchuensis IFO 4308]